MSVQWVIVDGCLRLLLFTSELVTGNWMKLARRRNLKTQPIKLPLGEKADFLCIAKN